jgi:hypothetical protein
MNFTPHELQALHDAGELETRLGAVESQLHALGSALKRQDALGAETAAAALHQALAQAVDDFSRVARQGSLPPALRRRLALTSGQVAAQRDAAARATQALDRSIDLLLGGAGAVGLYSAQGLGARHSGSGLASA